MEDRVEVEPDGPPVAAQIRPPIRSTLASTGILDDIRSSAFLVVENYGWYIILGIISAYFLYDRLSRAAASRAPAAATSSQYSDPDLVLAQQEKIAAARVRMQERLDAEVEREKQRQAEKEQKEYERKQQEWKNLQEGRGYYSKMKKPEEPAPVPESTAEKPAKKKEPLVKRDFNPMIGGSSGPSCSWRPAARRSGGG